MRLKQRPQYCTCGHQWCFRWYDYVLMIFSYRRYRCPKCYRLHKYKMTYFVNEVFDKETKENNIGIVEGKQELYKNG